MADDFLLIAVTAPEAIENETGRIVALLRQGEFRYVHLRKPGWDIAQTLRLIEAIPRQMRHRLVLHDHFSLAHEFSLGGVHLNRRNNEAPQQTPYSVSCHTIEELNMWPQARYMFLSPVYDSISKPGYTSKFNLADLKEHLAAKRVIALGGVDFSKLDSLKKMGFCGAAMLGALWNE